MECVDASTLKFEYYTKGNIKNMPEWKNIERICKHQVNMAWFKYILTPLPKWRKDNTINSPDSFFSRDEEVDEIKRVAEKVANNVRKRYNTYRLLHNSVAYSDYMRDDVKIRDDVGLDSVLDRIKATPSSIHWGAFERSSDKWRKGSRMTDPPSYKPGFSLDDSGMKEMRQLREYEKEVKKVSYRDFICIIPTDFSDSNSPYSLPQRSELGTKFDYIDNILDKCNKERIALEKAIADALGKRVNLNDDDPHDLWKEMEAPEISEKIRTKYQYYLDHPREYPAGMKEEEIPQRVNSRRKIRNVEKGGFFRLIKKIKDSKIGRFLQNLVILSTTANTVNKYYSINEFITKNVPQNIQAQVDSIAGMINDVFVEKVPSTAINTIENVQSKAVSGVNVITDLANTGATKIAPYISRIPVVSLNEKTIQTITAIGIACIGTKIIMNMPFDILAKREERFFNQQSEAEGER